MKDSQDRATEVFSAGTRDSPQTAAAVIGRSFSFRLLTAICKIDVDELFTIFEKAQQMGIIVANSEGPEKPFTFSHELVRQTLLAGISSPRRQHLHAGVADAIERLYTRPSRNAPVRSLIISSRQDRLLTNKSYSAI